MLNDQQCRMTDTVDRRPDERHTAGYAGRSLIVDDCDSLDTVRWVRSQPFTDLVRANPTTPVPRHEIDVQSKPPTHLVPQGSEMTDVEREYAVTG